MQAEQAPADYIRRQTLKGAERFITPELKAFEDKALSAQSRALAREKALYEELLERLIGHLAPLEDSASALAELDVLANLAERALNLDLNRPRFVEHTCLHIEQGRHPVVEQVLETPFVANDLALDADTRMLVITGPNMGGKSTYMRQTALIVLLAHIGSFVPAARCELSPGGPHLHPHRLVRRPCRRPLDLHGGDERNRQHPAQRHRQEPGADG